jgi:hypothetical protein
MPSMISVLRRVSLLIVCSTVQGNPADVTSSTLVVSKDSDATVTSANFVRIRKYILEKGKRQSYCNKFKDNPFWAFRDFNAYLDPPDRKNSNCEIGKSVFNELTIRVEKGGYTHIVLNETTGDFRIVKDYAVRDGVVSLDEVTGFFSRALTEIDKAQKKE